MPQEPSRPDQLPWQLFVAHQQLEALIDEMSYEDLYERFGGAPASETATRAALAALPAHEVTEKHACMGVGMAGYRSCPICLQLFCLGDEFRSLGCSHAFHRGCIDTWLLDHRGDCPVCRRRVVAEP